VEEKEKRKPKTQLAHMHLKKVDGNLHAYSTDGKILTTKFSSPTESDTTVHDINFLEHKCDIFKISSGLYCALWKNNPDKGFFFLTGNKKSVSFDSIDLKHSPNRLLKVLKFRKRCKEHAILK
jgi:hypothetical protein